MCPYVKARKTRHSELYQNPSLLWVSQGQSVWDFFKTDAVIKGDPYFQTTFGYRKTL
jgi:hypothetical protein